MRIRNWQKFQHFKDRRPPWIKLYRDLLDDVAWYKLAGDSAKALISIWLIASENDGFIPEVSDLAFRLRITKKQTDKILFELIDSGFVVDSDEVPVQDDLTPAQRAAKANGFGSRYITDEIKRQVMLRDKGVCVACQAPDRIEFDHIHPVSKGGESTLENIQLLCRPCNRKKRARLAETGADSGLRQAESLRSLETEGEIEPEKKSPSSSGDDATAKAAQQESKTEIAERFVAWFNEKADKSIPRCRMLTPERRRRILARLLEQPQREFWDLMMAKLNASDFLRGLVPGKNWRASLDFVIQNATNPVRIAEGAFENTARNQARRDIHDNLAVHE